MGERARSQTVPELGRLWARANAVGRLRDRVRGDPAALAVLAALLSGKTGTGHIAQAVHLTASEVNEARGRLWRHAQAIRSELDEGRN